MELCPTPRITLIEANSDGPLLEARDIVSVFSRDANTQYHPIPRDPREVAELPNAASRALTRTPRFLEAMKAWGIMPTSACLGSTMLSNRKSGTYFPEVTWQRASGATVRHWLRIRPPLYKQQETPETIRFMTGTCLFGDYGAVALLADGSRRSVVSTKLSLSSPIKELLITSGLSFYELDTACRLSNVIGSLAERLTVPAEVYVHIPVPEYILFMLGHKQVSCEGQIMRKWLNAVEQRGHLARSFFEEVLATEGAPLRIRTGSPLDEVIMPYLRYMITHSQKPSSATLAEIIAQSDTVTGKIFKYWLDVYKKRDIDYYELAHFGYAAGVVVNSIDSGLTIEVENPSEEQIFRSAARIIRRARRSGERDWNGNIVALYPIEQAIDSRHRHLDVNMHTEDNITSATTRAFMQQYGSIASLALDRT